VARFGEHVLVARRMVAGVLPAMRQRGDDRLVFVSSIQGRLVLPIIGPYGASTWALEALAETLAIETGHFGVKVSVVQPGAVSSGGAERANVFLKDDDPYAPPYEALGALRGEFVTTEDVATTVADTIEHPQPRCACRSVHPPSGSCGPARRRRSTNPSCRPRSTGSGLLPGADRQVRQAADRA
jgi:NADP-dependent 3-hydroxy acid dehydrogenase YdfG